MYNPAAIFDVSDDGFLGPLYSETCRAYAPTACSGGQYGTNEGGYSILWWSNSNSIAQLSGSSSNPTAALLGTGTGNGTGTGEVSNNSCEFQDTGSNTVNPEILLNNAKINAQTPGSIVIGQQATLTVNTGDIQLSSASWTVGGTTVTGWNPGPAPSTPNFNQNRPTFYWVPTYYYTSSMPTSWTAAVSVKANLSNGQSPSSSANVTVKAPSVRVHAILFERNLSRQQWHGSRCRMRERPFYSVHGPDTLPHSAVRRVG